MPSYEPASGYNLPLSDGADWALWWIPDHMHDMQSVACEHFAK